ncbi:MAG: aminoacyl-tRNA hydrolase [Candidatus Caldatribacteriaceae bacterium]
MFLLLGLGNPGEQFARTRHNVGFRVIESFAKDLGLRWRRLREVEWAAGLFQNERIYLLKPLTFMNRSGEGLRFFLTRYHLSNPTLIVVHDDLDFPPGVVKIKKDGGTGGHRGLESVLFAWGTPDFVRIRIGIGRPPMKEEVVEYVLGVPKDEEERILAEGEKRAKDALRCLLEKGLEVAMNCFNAPLKESK